MKTWLRRAAAFLAVAYVVVLVVATLLLRFVGERYWGTAVALYLPRIAFFAPLPFTVAALFFFGPRRLLPTQLVAALIVFFPLMGLTLPSPFHRAHAGRPSLRVLSFNVDSLFFGPDRVAEAIEGEHPDVVLLQEFPGGNQPFLDRLRRTFADVRVATQFVIATRFPLAEMTEPERLPYGDRRRSPRFVRYVVQSPFGSLAVYNVHPVSPRYGLYSLRGQGLRREILSGRLFNAARSGPLREDTGLRVLQVQTFAARAARESMPVLVAGDTNLPSLSPALADNLGQFTDGFRVAGSGFGYTFPARRSWMRIDRMFASAGLNFTSFHVGCKECSDHLCVVADVEAR